jgi:hypothetical protein
MKSNLLKIGLFILLAIVFGVIGIFIKSQKPIRKQITTDQYITMTGTTYLFNNHRSCTKLMCGVPCCNNCTAPIYLICNSDTFEIRGKPAGKEIICKGKDCEELDCSPIIIGKNYKLFGIFKENSTRKIFIVEDYELLN